MIWEEFLKRDAAAFRVRGLQRMQTLVTNPAFPAVHIAGTNGKGSVATKIAFALQTAGYKVGLYTSPHLVSFCERIAINSRCIAQEIAERLGEEMIRRADRLALKPTFFELVTLLAFAYFQQEGVDIAVIETGKGGRFDPTNVLLPLLAIITSISRDHLPELGKNLKDIAREKAGIIKRGTPLILGPNAHYEEIMRKAKRLNAPLFHADKAKGFYDDENSAIAKKALELISLHFPLSEEAIKKGISIRPRHRFERVGHVIFDVAHNLDGFKRLIEALDLFFPKRGTRFLIGIARDKDVEACLKTLAETQSPFHLVAAETDNATPPEKLAECFMRFGYFFFSYRETFEETVKEAHDLASKNHEILIVCGSFYIMERARSVLFPERPLGGTLSIPETSERLRV
jgi:dihydrofolate synthase / folylpolyglutamate synthase